MRRSAFTLMELGLVAGLLGLIMTPVMLMMSRGSQEAKTSRDEFLAALFLSELSDQVAVLGYAELPAAGAPVDLKATGVHRLRQDRPASSLYLSVLPDSFQARTIRVDEPAGGTIPSRRVTMRIEYLRAGGKVQSLEVVTLVYPGPGTGGT